MIRAAAAALALSILCAALSACASSMDRGLQYCQDNYFGYTQLRCEQQIRNQHRR